MEAMEADHSTLAVYARGWMDKPVKKLSQDLEGLDALSAIAVAQRLDESLGRCVVNDLVKFVNKIRKQTR